MYLIEFLKGMVVGLALYACFALLLLWIRLVWKKRKQRKKLSRRRMEGGSPKIYPRRMPIGGHGQIVDVEMQNLCDSDQNGRSNSESTSVSSPEVSKWCKSNRHQKTSRTNNLEIVNEQNRRKKVKFPSTLTPIQGRRKGTESNHIGPTCTGEFQNSEPIIKKERSIVPSKSSDNSERDQTRRSNSSSTSSSPPEISMAWKNNQVHKHHMTSRKMDLETVNEQIIRKRVIDLRTLSSVQGRRKSEMGPSKPTACVEGNRSKETAYSQPGGHCRGQLHNSEPMIERGYATRSTAPPTSRGKSGLIIIERLG